MPDFFLSEETNPPINPGGFFCCHKTSLFNNQAKREAVQDIENIFLTVAVYPLMKTGPIIAKLNESRK